ncbi:pseudaminic acid biosynthesis-associated methylase [uncultured Desulfobacter sp.]|uniref:pseudaminic acid biosynthesis-associated methylase n=1 Tax=uncultured Desulfobacter sp. TaxID=240139 RepID=UPI002AA621BD|nr:pseudaminic acid biosynthesis-associated methylase [uncultured Desulfobacter sp.]
MGMRPEHLPEKNVFEMSILDFDPISFLKKVGVDLVLSKGVLIHIDPDMLQNVYDKLYSCTKKYLFVAEYYSPKPVSIIYRGHENKLFKRDFAGELMDQFPDLSLRDYGFVYHRDLLFPQDDINWFLLEKM